MQKKGQSQIITGILLVAISLVAFLIVFNIVKPLVSDKSGQVGNEYEKYLEELQKGKTETLNKINNINDGTQTNVLTEGTQTQQIPTDAINVTSCQTLNQAGKYYVLRNDILLATGTCFTITANNVVLDLNGFIVSGSAQLPFEGVFSENYNFTTIKNGNINNFNKGINYIGNNATFENLKINSYHSWTGLFMPSYGINLIGDNNQIKNVEAKANYQVYQRTSGFYILSGYGININGKMNQVINSKFCSDSTGSSNPDIYCTSNLIDGGNNNCGVQSGCGISCNSCQEVVNTIPLTACGQSINQAGKTYVLQTDITANINCFNIAADNVTLDCQGKSITSTNALTAIYVRGSYTNIKNCKINITNGNGIYLEYGANSYIYNNEIVNANYGILIKPTNNQNILLEGNRINYNKYGVYQKSNDYNYYTTYNTIKNNEIRYNQNGGLYNYRGNYDKILNNTISDNKGYGLYIESQAYNIDIKYNKIKNNLGNGISLDLVYNFNIIGNEIISNNDSGLYWIMGGKTSNINDNLINSNGKYGIYTNIWDSKMNNNTVCSNKEKDFYCESHLPFVYQFIGTGNKFGNISACPGGMAGRNKDIPYEVWPKLGTDYTACIQEVSATMSIATLKNSFGIGEQIKLTESFV